jgi:aspartyl-tRNA(Asn)/glutamyl-tRNA(Gln) amidotransferase subunit C
MKISREEVIHVADLARLDVDKELIDKLAVQLGTILEYVLAVQLGTILEYVDTLENVDTKGVRPTSHAISMTNAFREDEEKQLFNRDSALANAPDKADGNFIVPKVVG